MSDDHTPSRDSEIAEAIVWYPATSDSDGILSLATLLEDAHDSATDPDFLLAFNQDHAGDDPRTAEEVTETVDELFRRRHSAAVIIARLPDGAATSTRIYSFAPGSEFPITSGRTRRAVTGLVERIRHAAESTDSIASRTYLRMLPRHLRDVFERHPNCLIVLTAVSLPPAGLSAKRSRRLMGRPIQALSRKEAESELERLVRRNDADMDIADATYDVLDKQVELTIQADTPHYFGGPARYSSIPPDLPTRVRTDPLPHDGLFIRRNNAFGTKSTLGITDLIEHGVLIDQTQIRFDDFIASRADEVPSPSAGEAVAVSHGGAAVLGNAKAYQGTTHFLEIALRAADEAGDDAAHGEALPVNFVFVVDTSYSMHGEKLDTVKASLRQLYDQLRDIDILGIVTFNTQVRTALKATPKAELSVDRLTSIVSGLSADGGTDLNLGVLYGIDEIGRYGHDRSDLVNCLYLFSDGDPTSGQTSWIKIRKNIAERLRGDLTISCFGFGTDARMRELEALAGLAGGHATFVVNPDDIRLNLMEDLTRREHLAAINVQLRLEIDPNIRIWHLYGHDLVTDPAVRDAVIQDTQAARRKGEEQFGTRALPDLITEEKGIRIFAPDLAFGETYWIVLEVELPTGSAPTELGRATVQYVDTVARDNRRHDLDLTLAGPIPGQTVAAHAIGLWTSEITFYALDDLYEHDRETAKERLSRHAKALQDAQKLLPDSQLRDDRVTIFKLASLTENLGNPQVWRDPGHMGGGGNVLAYTMYAMNEFGRVRNGYNRVTYRA